MPVTVLEEPADLALAVPSCENGEVALAFTLGRILCVHKRERRHAKLLRALRHRNRNENMGSSGGRKKKSTGCGRVRGKEAREEGADLLFAANKRNQHASACVLRARAVANLARACTVPPCTTR